MRRWVLVLACLLTAASSGSAAGNSRRLLDELIDPADWKAAGISKLTADEQAYLVAWITKAIGHIEAINQKPVPGQITAAEMSRIKESPQAGLLMATVEAMGPDTLNECGLSKLSFPELERLGALFQITLKAVRKTALRDAANARQAGQTLHNSPK